MRTKNVHASHPKRDLRCDSVGKQGSEEEAQVASGRRAPPAKLACTCNEVARSHRQPHPAHALLRAGAPRTPTPPTYTHHTLFAQPGISGGFLPSASLPPSLCTGHDIRAPHLSILRHTGESTLTNHSRTTPLPRADDNTLETPKANGPKLGRQ